MNTYNKIPHTKDYNERKYYNGHEIELCCNILDVDMHQIFKNEGITIGQSGLKGLKLTAKESSNVFYSIISEYGKDDFHIELANGFVKTPVGLAHVGFVTSANVADGIARSAKIKQLSTPAKWELRNNPDSIKLEIIDIHPDFSSNGYSQIMSFIWIVKSCRNYTLKNIVPERIVISSEIPHIKKIEKDLGCDIEVSTYNVLELDQDVAKLPLYSKNELVSNSIDSESLRMLAELANPKQVHAIAEQYIKKMLPSGNVTTDRVSHELGMSRRTFERRLKQENYSFGKLLEDIRSDMSLRYLVDERYLIPEISFMLGFEEPNSFYRSFKKWHGLTPNQYRMLHHPSASDAKKSV